MNLAKIGKRWMHFCERHGISAEIAERWFSNITWGYATPAAHYYHGIDHVWSCLRTFDKVRHLAEHPDIIELAIWFHDIIYIPGKTDNEEMSAKKADQFIEHVKVLVPWKEKLFRLILATKHTGAQLEPDEKIIVDVDLSILGSNLTRYGIYANGIWREYKPVVPDKFVYSEHRKKFLEDMLAKAYIYNTDWFRERFEYVARSNMNHEISMIVAQAAEKPLT